jgi:hypothetical protein
MEPGPDRLAYRTRPRRVARGCRSVRFPISARRVSLFRRNRLSPPARRGFRFLIFAGLTAPQWVRYAAFVQGHHVGSPQKVGGWGRAGLSSEPPPQRLRSWGRPPASVDPSHPGRPVRRWLRFAKSIHRRKLIAKLDLQTALRKASGMVQKARFSGNIGGRLPGLDERGSQDRPQDRWRQFRVKRV